MMTTVLSIIGVVLSIITTIALYLLSSIRSSQEKVVNEIKEMNTDMRNILARMSANDVRFESINQRLGGIEDTIKTFETRIHVIEVK